MKWGLFSAAPARLIVLAMVVAVGVGFGVAALTGSFSAQAAPDEVYVNDNLFPDIEGCNNPDATTIAEGITAADPGATVIVCDGTYVGTTVNKSVTIAGRAEADRDKVKVVGASDGLIVSADDVIVQHMTLDGIDGTDVGIQVTGNGYSTGPAGSSSMVPKAAWWKIVSLTIMTWG
jgi:hypothetical protein